MSRKNFLYLAYLVLLAILISACGSSAATQQAIPTEAPAATEAPAQIPQANQSVAESEFVSISTEPVSSADINLYNFLTKSEPTPANAIALALSIRNVNPASIPSAPSQPVNTYQLGQVRSFWAQNATTLQFNLINAKLMWISDHAYFWQDTNINQEFSAEDWMAAGKSFDSSYERVRAIFGNEESLGLDGDPRLFIVHSNTIGDVGGYFSELDQLPAAVDAHSNQGQFFFISNQKTSSITSEYYKEVLAHEFQHMIQKNVDPNEEGWLNEGLSMLAQQIAGMRGDNWVKEFVAQPDQSLWYWSKSYSDYGQSYLYLDYLYEQLGENFIKALSANPVNGAVSIDQTLKQFNSPRDSDKFYLDAMTAAFFNNSTLQSGQFAYQIPVVSNMPPTYEATILPVTYQGTVQQYGGVDVLTFTANGNATLNFTGDQRAKLIPIEAHSGDRMWWSNRNDSSFATLTRRVDLTHTLTANLTYWSWYDLEENWDYAYLLVSTDNGNHWAPVSATSSRDTNPNDQNYGNGFSGISGRGSAATWIQETANLNAYAGKQILLRFAVQTNHSVNNFGFAVDDLSIPEIGWNENVETGDKDWISDGFVAIHNRIPQVWGVRAVEQNKDNTIVVHDLNVSNGTGSLEINFDTLNRLVVFIIGQTHYTTLPASYQVEVTP
ncbi:MAG: immune inhibitor A [Anaerolineales bacterium]